MHVDLRASNMTPDAVVSRVLFVALLGRTCLSNKDILDSVNRNIKGSFRKVEGNYQFLSNFIARN